jgi:hypothetical protein
MQSIMSSAPDVTFTIEDNRITDNHADFAGGGASILVSAEGDDASLNPQNNLTAPANAKVLFQKNLVAKNEATGGVGTFDPVGGGVFAFLLAAGEATATLDLQFNTIVDNVADEGAAGIELETFTDFDIYGGAEEGLAVLEVSNSIIANPSGTFGIGGPNPGAGTSNRDVSAIAYNDVFDHTQNYETWVNDRTGQDGNVSVDPALGAFPGYIPGTCSPTIDAGDPVVDVGLEPAPNGDRINIGHTGGTASAAISLADPSGDNAVDGIDILRLAVAFGSTPMDLRWDPLADLDGSGLVDGDDLDFITLLQFGATCQ